MMETSSTSSRVASLSCASLVDSSKEKKKKKGKKSSSMLGKRDHSLDDEDHPNISLESSPPTNEMITFSSSSSSSSSSVAPCIVSSALEAKVEKKKKKKEKKEGEERVESEETTLHVDVESTKTKKKSKKPKIKPNAEREIPTPPSMKVEIPAASGANSAPVPDRMAQLRDRFQNVTARHHAHDVAVEQVAESSALAALSARSLQQRHEHVMQRWESHAEQRTSMQLDPLAIGGRLYLDSSHFEGRDWTVSIAIPGSLLAPVLQYPDIASLTAYHIARMVISFGADEVIVYSDDGSPPLPLPIGNPRSIPFQPPCKLSDDPTAYLATLLYFYQTPSCLRKHVFPTLHEFAYPNMLPPLGCSRVLENNEWSQYRDGIVLIPKASSTENEGTDGEEREKPERSLKSNPKDKFIFAGIKQKIGIPSSVLRDYDPFQRVTIKFSDDDWHPGSLSATIVSEDEPRMSSGMAWGFRVRTASGLSSVIAECPFEEKYDLTVGISASPSCAAPIHEVVEKINPSFRHLLLVFGPDRGLDAVVARDPKLRACRGRADVLFDHWTFPLGMLHSKQVATEDLIGLALGAISPIISKRLGSFPKVDVKEPTASLPQQVERHE